MMDFASLAKCGYPTIKNPVKVKGYDDGNDGLLANVGTIINFTCLSDLSLIGPSSATCTRNGEWEPDPQDVECISMSFRVFCIIIPK